MEKYKLTIFLASAAVAKLFTALYGGTNLVFHIPIESWRHSLSSQSPWHDMQVSLKTVSQHLNSNINTDSLQR